MDHETILLDEKATVPVCLASFRPYIYSNIIYMYCSVLYNHTN